MRKLFMLASLVILIASVLPRWSRAQAEILLEEMDVSLWPEYDRGDMLVIYQGTLQAEITSADLTFHIPLAANMPSRVLVWGEDGNWYTTEYTYRRGSAYGEVTFHANNPRFKIEYYDPRLEKNGPNRKFTYTWPGDYAVISAFILVQRPSDTDQMQFTPEMTTNFIGVDNLFYYKLQIGTLQKAQVYDLTLSYVKSSPELTYEKQKISVAGGDLPQSMWTRTLPWAVGVLALLIIAAGLLFYWRAGMPEAGEKGLQSSKAVFPASSEVVADDSGVYCHNCGRRGALNDLFCRSCGSKLRI